MAMIRLHQWEMSPFCTKVRRSLRHKGLAFEVENYNGLKARHAVKLTPVGTLPVLEYDGERIVDSAAIAAFLDRKHPDPPLYPRDPEERARARFWEDWAGESLYFFEVHFRMLDPVALEKALDLITEGRPSYERALLKVIFKRRYPAKLKSQGLGRLTSDEVDRKFFGHLDDLEAILAKHAWLVGAAPSVADISVGSQLDEMVRTSRHADRILGYPKIRAWLAALDGATPAAK